MRLYELFLTESIHIDQEAIGRIQSAFLKWQVYLQGIDYVDANMDRHTYESYVNKLTKGLTPVIRNIIQPYFKSEEELNKHRLNKDVPVNGYTFRMEIYGWGGGNISTHASVNNWHTMYDKRNSSRSYNTLSLKITPVDIVNLRSGRTPVIDRMTSYIVHEITHLIQGLKSAYHTPHGSDYAKSSDDAEESYLGSSHEIESFAQETAACIYMRGKVSGDVVTTIDHALVLIRMGMHTMFNRNMFSDNNGYARYKAAFRSFDNNVISKLSTHQQRLIWRRYNKKLIEKLLKYKVGS